MQTRVFDNFSTGKRENLLPIQDKIEVCEGDLRDFALVMDATKGIDVIFHEAALPSVIRSVKAPNTTNDVNVSGTLNLLEAACTNKVKKIIFASSSSVYGDSASLPKHEDMIPNPLSPYAVSKIAGEYYMRVFHRLYGIKTVILRYFNVYGPCQDPNSEYSGVVAKFITAFASGRPLTVFGDGEQSRDFTYVDDIVQANIAAAGSDIEGDVINIAGGNRHSLNEMVEILKSIFKKQTYDIKYTNPRPGDIKHSQAAVEKAYQKLGFQAKYTFEKGLMKTVDWSQHKE
jgi:UDP-glucose 4-epimerase